MTIEYRNAPVTRASRDGRTVEVRALKYNVLDSYRTVFAPGFGVAGLERWKPTICLNHDWDQAVGVTTSSRIVAGDGIYCMGRLSDPDKVPDAKRAAALLADRVIREVSIGFGDAVRRDPTAAECERWPGIDQVIVDGEILEVSLLTVRGAVPGAEVLSFRRATTLPGAWVDDEHGEAMLRWYADGCVGDRPVAGAVSARAGEVLSRMVSRQIDEARRRGIGPRAALSGEERS